MSTRIQAAPEASLPRERIFHRNYSLTWLASMSSFGSFYLLFPVIPVYVLALGGTEAEVGLVSGAFYLSSVLLRPFIGRQVDLGARRTLMIIGATIFVIGAAGYSLVGSVAGLIAIRILHGTAKATYSTAANVLVADTSPVRRRGEALGLYNAAFNLAMAFGPALGAYLVARTSFTPIFAISAGLSAIALVAALLIREPRREPPKDRPPLTLLNGDAVLPASIIFTATGTYGAVLSFLPIFVMQTGIGDAGLFFTVYAIVLMASRPVVGRLTDAFGRVRVIIPGLTLAGSAIIALGFVTASWQMFVVAAVYAAGFAAQETGLMAYTVDRAAPERRGSAMATYILAYDLGIGLGALILGVVLGLAGFQVTFATAGMVVFAGITVLFLADRRERKEAA